MRTLEKHINLFNKLLIKVTRHVLKVTIKIKKPIK